MADDNITQQIMEVLADPMNLPSEFWNYMIQKWLADAPVLPISQVFGFTQFTAQQAAVDAQETTTSTSFVDLTTPGPTLTGLPDGKYILLMGCWSMSNNSGQSADMSISVNGASVVGNDGMRQFQTVGATAVARAISKSLSNNGSNTVSCQYRASGGVTTATFVNRWLIAFKYSNL